MISYFIDQRRFVVLKLRLFPLFYFFSFIFCVYWWRGNQPQKCILAPTVFEYVDALLVPWKQFGFALSYTCKENVYHDSLQFQLLRQLSFFCDWISGTHTTLYIFEPADLVTFSGKFITEPNFRTVFVRKSYVLHTIHTFSLQV